jgi:adenosylcobinamide kinase/adenosylcobinamide-phosphate guanylyltransferase
LLKEKSLGKIVMITGGARSGKSFFAEQLLSDKKNVLYVATAQPFDDEMKDRIKKHRDRRDPRWETLEFFNGSPCLASSLSSKEAMLFDCLTLMVTGLMLEDKSIDWNAPDIGKVNSLGQKINSKSLEVIDAARAFRGMSVFVTNEVGMGIVPDNPMSRIFRDYTGVTNSFFARNADTVIFMVSGMPHVLKGPGSSDKQDF